MSLIGHGPGLCMPGPGSPIDLLINLETALDFHVVGIHEKRGSACSYTNHMTVNRLYMFRSWVFIPAQVVFFQANAERLDVDPWVLSLSGAKRVNHAPLVTVLECFKL